MIMRRRISSIGCCLLVCIASSTALAAEQLYLWPKGAPGARGGKDSDKPHVDVYLPEGDRPVSAIVICPGGAYGALALDHEGKQVADWLSSIGVAAYVLHYRHHGGGYRHPVPLEDAQRAVRLVRSRASEAGYPADHIGILGFSAGGHLASTVGTHFDRGNASAHDPIDRQGCRPDFMVLAYPVITLTGKAAHLGSVHNLLGDRPDAKLAAQYSSNTQVTNETPPTFLMHTTADRAVLPQNSILFYSALVEHNVPAELHIYEEGPHGVGLGKKYPGASQWSEACAQWLRAHGWARGSSQ